VEGLSRAMLATARPSCYYYLYYCATFEALVSLMNKKCCTNRRLGYFTYLRCLTPVLPADVTLSLRIQLGPDLILLKFGLTSRPLLLPVCACIRYSICIGLEGGGGGGALKSQAWVLMDRRLEQWTLKDWRLPDRTQRTDRLQLYKHS